MSFLISKPFKKYLSNTIWLLGDRLLRMAISLIVVVYMARYLGPDKFGIFNYSIALVSLFGIVTNLGMDRILIRDVVYKPDQANEVIGTIFFLRLIFGILFCIIAYFTSTIFNANNPLIPILVAILGSGLIFQAFNCIELWFQSEVKAKYNVIVKSSAFFLVSTVKILIILLGGNIIALAFASLSELVLIAIGLYGIYKLMGNRVSSWRFESKRAKKLLSESWPEILAGFGTLICMKMDQIMLGELLNTHAVGIYTAASQLSSACYFVPVAIVSSTYPALLRAKQKDESIYYNRLSQTFIAVVVVSYLIAVSLSLLSSFIMNNFYGNAYHDSVIILIIHVWTIVFAALGVSSGSWVFAERKVKLSFYRMLAGVCINLFLNSLLIPTYGGIGAAFATLISLMMAYYWFDLFNRSTRKLFFMKTRALFLAGSASLFKQILNKQQI